MSKGPVRSRRSADDSIVVVGEGCGAAALREALGGRGPEIAPAESNDLSAPWLEGARAVVLVAPAGEFGVKVVKGGSRRAHLVEQARRVARAAEVHGVGQVVGVTSAMVHGASADRPDIEDDDPVSPEAAGFVADLVAFEVALAESLATAPGADTSGSGGAPDDGVRPRLALLRPAMVVGPGVDTILTRHFEADRKSTRLNSSHWE